tara:strand:+ start:1087 stop:1278 length:192 start_codon:yes stop_codon:yes gene_type:complete
MNTTGDTYMYEVTTLDRYDHYFTGIIYAANQAEAEAISNRPENTPNGAVVMEVKRISHDPYDV